MATFGHTGIGASEQSGTNGYQFGSKFTPSENGTLTSISIRVATYTAAANLRCAIFADSAGSPAELLAVAGADTAVGAGSTWYTSNVSYAFTGSTAYWLAFLTDTTGNYYAYDTPGDVSNQGAFIDGVTYPTFRDPFPEAFLDYKFSIYATYTPAGGGGTGAGTRRYGDVPSMGTQRIGPAGTRGGVWGRSTTGLYVPRRLAA